MTAQGPQESGAAADATALAAWVEATVGGTVTRIEPLLRWRPAWDIDVELDGAVLPLHARGERERNFAIPFRIADEVASHHLLEDAGLPAPHVHGLCDRPYTLVMDRLPGLVDLSFADDDAQRDALIEEYLEMLPTIYGIDLDVAAAGFAVPDDGIGAALGAFEGWERAHDALMPEPEPVAAFLRAWLHRNVPRDRDVRRYITYDAFQFMFADGAITGLLDFELAHVGDPLKDLAALRVRDSIKNLGDLASIAARYEEITGIEVDHDVVDYHAVMYNSLTVLSAGPPLAAPAATTDVISHMAWWVNSARWALEIIADIGGYALEAIDPLPARTTRHRGATAHLAAALHARARQVPDDYELGVLQRLARHVVRVDESGAAAVAADIDDVGSLLGQATTATTLDTDLLDRISRGDPADDEALVRLLDRRAQRLHALIAPDGSLLRRHPRLRSLRAGTDDAPSDDERWPAGAIPGTR